MQTTPPQAIIDALTNAPGMADAIRRTEVQRLASFSDVERAALDIERKRLAAKYGAESPQVKAATARLEWLDKERAGIDAELVRETIQVPNTTADSFVVYGRILNTAVEGLQAMTVAAVDPSGKELAGAVSGEDGVFEVRVPVQPSRPGGARDNEQQTTEAAVHFQLQISARKSGPSFKDDEVFEAASNRLAYREIIVPDRITLRQQRRSPPR